MLDPRAPVGAPMSLAAQPTLEHTPFARVPAWRWGLAIAVALTAGAFAPTVVTQLLPSVMLREGSIADAALVSTTLGALATLWLGRWRSGPRYFGICLLFAVLNAPLAMMPILAAQPDGGSALGMLVAVTLFGSVVSLPLGFVYAVALAAPRDWLRAGAAVDRDGAQRVEKAALWCVAVTLAAWAVSAHEAAIYARVSAAAALGLALWALALRASQRRALARIAAGHDPRFELAAHTEAPPPMTLGWGGGGPVLVARVARSEGPFRDVVTRAPLLALGDHRRTIARGIGASLLAGTVAIAVLAGPSRASLEPTLTSEVNR